MPISTGPQIKHQFHYSPHRYTKRVGGILSLKASMLAALLNSPLTRRPGFPLGIVLTWGQEIALMLHGPCALKQLTCDTLNEEGSFKAFLAAIDGASSSGTITGGRAGQIGIALKRKPKVRTRT